MHPLPNAELWRRVGASIDLEGVQALRAARVDSVVSNSCWREVIELLQSFQHLLNEEQLPLQVIHGHPALTVTSAAPASSSLTEKLDTLIERFIPWRKGPFELLGKTIDSEWRSDLKWGRIAPILGSLEGQIVGDIGCSNGYYLFRALELNPRAIFGFDPVDRSWLTFSFLNLLIQNPRVHVEPFGIDDLHLFPEVFDTLLCLGVIYHRPDPFSALRALRKSLKPGGRLILESIALPGDESSAVAINGRYAKMKNVHFLPTAKGLLTWLEKAGFVDIEHFSTITLDSSEQRRTAFAPGESLSDFLDPRDPSKTVEGHPAPLRVCARAVRP